MLAKVLPKGGARQVKPFMAFIADNDTAQTVSKAASEAGIADPTVVKGGIGEAVRKLSKTPTPELLLVDLSGSADPLSELGALAEVCDEGARVVTIGDANDIALYRTLISNGVQDYLVKPVVSADLVGAISRCKNPEASEGDGNKVGRLIAFVGARGGVGATTIAVNTAWMLANEHKSRVAMVDLDLFFGNCGLALDLQPGHGFREALENPSRIDGLFIERAMVRESDNLLVLTGEEALDYVITFDPSSVEVLLDHLRRDFPYVVVDIPRFAARSQLNMLAAPASVVVISDPSLVGMRDTQRLVNLFKKSAPQAEIVVALNRVGANKSAELSKADFEKSAEIKVDQIIPCDLKALALSAGSGKALAKAAPKAPVTNAVRQLSGRFQADAKALASKAGWKKWVRGR